MSTLCSAGGGLRKSYAPDKWFKKWFPQLVVISPQFHTTIALGCAIILKVIAAVGAA
jgi:hypothetical protein